MVATKRKYSTIRVLYNQNGARLDTFDDMSNEVVSFFVNQLGVADPAVKASSVSIIKDILGFSLTSEVADTLCIAISEAEIKEALWGQGNNKSPGPDGYNAFFFKRAWSIVGEDFLAAVRYCFDHSFMLPSFNATVVVLAPKIPNPSLVKDFRPISCYTVVYKTVTKILVNQLSSVFPNMISLNQTAFVKGMSIIDNTLLAQEIVRGYSRSKISPRCALKVNLQKTFDSLIWGFINVILHTMGLPEKFIGWTWACFANPRYSIIFNGSLVGYFKGARGVRLGDPLSPYIFVLAMNVLSNLLNMAAAKGIFSYHPKCKRIGLTHLCFADDLLIFCKGTLDSIMGVQAVLDHFYSMSGLKLNASKCELYAAGIPDEQLASSRRALVSNWSRQLILPQAIIKKVEQLCPCFFWKGSDTPTKGARVSWKTICLLKSEGGLGIHDIGGWNKSCSVQLIRKLLANNGSLWVVWMRSYTIRNADFWQMEVPKNASWSFKYLLKIRPEAAPILVGQVQEVSTSYIWDKLCSPAPKVPWHHLVWFSGRIPKHSIIVWMTLLNRLPTRVRLLRMGLDIETDKCLLCGAEAETRDHLFFECQFSKELWGFILNLCCISRKGCSCESELAWASLLFKGKSLIVGILKLVWSRHIYCIWNERNVRLFGNRARLKDELLGDIKETIRIRLVGKVLNRLDLVNNALCAN
ncbi:uncharacterized protein LOC120218393 [Hibiscus syriacus]|uniref:uncharacterized protein LOC120218393 n=1 Tax=Hibiscus syriacus TaxID=106335 RepID=UPI0019216ABE|nr:uncharacterized protein LOC120218393 [Hibiscus syriacus]